MAPPRDDDRSGPAILDLPDPRDVVRPVRFALVDVFGAGPLTGNPLAVLDLRHCTGGDPPVTWMAAVAQEMNQAETTFVLPPTATAAARLRSFTAGGVEVFGAGHNALGAWWWLLETGRVARPASGAALVQEIGDRHLDVRVETDLLTMLQSPIVLCATAAPDAVGAALGLAAEQVDSAVPPRVVGTGADHLMVAVHSGALPACRPDRAALVELGSGVGAQGVYVAEIGSQRPVGSVETRFFNPGVGLDEDPATGSAAGPLVAYLDHLRLLADRRLTIVQGTTMGRPSTLYGHLTSEDVPAIGGAGAITAQGWIAGPLAQDDSAGAGPGTGSG
jgi:trans-2,3-dihydro-3-hydroxyanthranilate isomerase